jgi:hypothetical protein
MGAKRPGAPARARRPGIDCQEQRSHTTLTAAREANFRQICRRRAVERVYGLGARAVYELLDELIGHEIIVNQVALDSRLAKYAAFDPAQLASVGGDRMPTLPLHLVDARL